ncbi:hypothetical protein [Millisia brevis]|uniref:hypothetical protein n=1 Tax=Millisia brevis TaxID=264148 RepID=UPI0012ECD750|nr:hypothetical protein [Millisia brevis]
MRFLLDNGEIPAAWVKELYRQELTQELTRLGLWMLPLLILLLAVASVVRAGLAASWEPVGTTLLSFGIGLLSIPIFSWVLALLFWGYSLARGAAIWLSALAERVRVYISELMQGPLGGILIVVLGVVGAGVVLWITPYLLRGLRDSSALRYGLAAVALVGGLGIAFWELLLPILNFGSSVLGTVFGVVIGVVYFVLVWGLLSAILAQHGSVAYVPIRNAFGAGMDRSVNADCAASIGVSLSIIMAAASFNGEFRSFAQSSVPDAVPQLSLLYTIPVGDYLPALVVPFFDLAFSNFTGIPEIAILVVASLGSAISLAFWPVRDRSTARVSAVASMAFIRVLVVFLLTIVTLAAFSQYDD